ncbi:ThiF family adenylyltransferase [Ferruginibacter lapsinanis]|uniref:ThiF family adenylyltransferase n=1 Tax=Ferruginibacter lapsinanis TaxID=563172 RepID=UPI001E622E7E|nr:ThiF family adenylyltransferase [Ferruginibacter lapsinanis]UEG49364.1 ThiF family adenylyltransferase [Ferruginibacter lapsinanis]
MLFSEELEPYTGELPESINNSINEIKRFFNLEEVAILKFDNYNIAIPVVFTVPIPPMGTVNDIDIRSEEPILIKFSLTQYPNIIPRILSNRKDFPKKYLSHLYASENETEPARLCLVRNDPNEWFSNKTTHDLLAVTEQWLFKAAIGKLVDDGDEFDPIRLESYKGYHIYKYDMLNRIVSENLRFTSENPFAILLGYVYKDDYQNVHSLTYRSLSLIPFISIATTLEAIKKINTKLEDKIEAFPLFSILIWKEDNAIESDYYTELPKNYDELKLYFQARSIDINDLITNYRNIDLHLRNGIPVIYAIKRPKKIIGYDGDYEFINFLISAGELKKNKIPGSAKVSIQSHIEPFSKALAEKVSGEKRNSKSFYVGAGSLGSKIIIHDARSGKMDIGVIDSDDFLQHNLTRHALYNGKIGLNKANAVIKEIKDLFESDSTNGFVAYDYKIHNISDEILNNYDWLIDTTASNNVLNWLVQKEVPENLSIARCEIVNDGKLGLLYIEGANRNPRIDDLVSLAYYEAVKNPIFEDWRKRDSEREVTNLSVGLGCSSSTTIMPDDIISLHSSIFSKVLHNESDKQNISDLGLMYASIFDNEGLPIIKSESQLVEPFDIYSCNVGSKWELRMLPGLKDKFFQLCKEKGDIETGGVLIGVSNYKTKTIHVFDIIQEPQDSKGSCNGFIRGVKGLPEQVEYIKQKTGQVIGYVGEWHTHPMDLESLSCRDKQTIEELITINRTTPIPTCAVIVTNEKILPFIFE